MNQPEKPKVILKRQNHLPIMILFVTFLMSSQLYAAIQTQKEQETQGSKIVVLTFDDAAKSHRSFVAPLLKKLNFGATFFITYEWMNDTENFMTWEEVTELNKMGFEIGNHSWHHWNYSQPKTVAMLEGELGLINYELQRRDIPLPKSFAWDGNGFSPEGVEVLTRLGYRYARRGKQPEIPYGELTPGPGFDPDIHHRLLIPTTLDGYPDLDFEHFVAALESVQENEIAVLQFHGVPDIAHPWVNTSKEKFKQFVNYLKDHDYQVIAMRDLEPYLPDDDPIDPMLNTRYPARDADSLDWPDEVMSTRKHLDYWLANMAFDHHYSLNEMSRATGMDSGQVSRALSGLPPLATKEHRIKVRPYPGVRHPRIGFKDGMLNPMRGTKASIFLPWAPDEFVVLDLPEALFSQLGLTFLGHKHIPTIFDYEKIVIPNNDWTISEDGSLSNLWKLPNGIIIGTEIHPDEKSVDMKLWLQNNSDTPLTQLRTQICIMLKQATQFNALSNDNKIFNLPVTAVKSGNVNHWIITAWDHCQRTWGNENCPCMHADPQLPDCKPGETVSVKGKIWFYEGTDIKDEIRRIKQQYSAL